MINIYISVNATYRKTSIPKETLGSNTAQSKFSIKGFFSKFCHIY